MFEILNEVPTYIVTILILLITVVIGSLIIDGLDTQIQSDASYTNETKTVSERFKTKFLSAWDLFSVTMLFIFFGGSIWLAYRSPSNPIMLWGGLLYLVICVFISMVISNVYEGFLTQNVMFATKVSEMTFFPLIMNNLVIVSIIYIVTISVVLMIGTGGGISE